MSPSTLAPFCAAIRMKIGFVETFPTNSCGVQPTFVAVTSAVIVCDGRAKMTNVSAPAAFSARICCTRLVRVVLDGEVDLSAVDAAVRVDVREVGAFGRGNRLVQRRHPGERERAADLDRGGRDARIGTMRAEGGRCGHRRNEREPGENRRESALPTHQPSYGSLSGVVAGYRV